ncbi:hypothetical protein HYS00_04915 [Candidatus Microgenomates bacterium]|nr:hypothetical protein [Candidatus Microgenomates bacterium]
MKNPSSALSDTIRTYEEALQKGVHIGDYETLKKLRYARTLADNGRQYQERAITVGIVLALILAFIRLILEQSSLNTPVPHWFAYFLDTITSGLSAPVTTISHPTVKALLIAGIKAIETALVFGGLVGIIFNVLQQRIARQNLRGQLSSLLNDFEEAREQGMLPVITKEPFVATHYINDESIFENTVGESLGWGTRALAFCETDKNPSSAQLWIRLPDNNINKGMFFEAFERGHMENAYGFVFFPQADDHMFLPDPSDNDLFHIGLAGFIERVSMIDQYLESKQKPLIPIIVIADELMNHSVFLFSEEKSSILETVTLRQEVAEMNKSRPDHAKIHIIDPTNLALMTISTPLYNKHDLPLAFVSDPAHVQMHGSRFIEKIHNLTSQGVKIKHMHAPTSGNDSLKVGYHIEDIVATQQLTSISPDNVVIITHHEADTAIVKNYPVIELDRLIVAEIKRILRINV